MQLDRRQFVTWSAGGALLLGLGVNAGDAEDAPPISPWIRIAPDGRITLYSTVSEMGQGARTGQAQVLADELDAPWDRIEVELGAPTPGGPFAVIGTGGSSSIRRHWTELRSAGAAVRAQLVAAAARRWNCPLADCRTEAGRVVRVSRAAHFDYGALAAEAAQIQPPADPPLKPASAWRYIGKPLPTFENADKSTGRARYGVDVRLPGMLHASIAAAPVYGATLVSVDETPALAVPGVTKVVKLDDAVAVVAASTWAAFKGVRALKPQWSTPALASSSADIDRRLTDALGGPDATTKDPAARGALRARIDRAARKVEADYRTAYLAHATLEPMNTTVRVMADKVEAWSPTQTPTLTRMRVAKATGRTADQVVLHNTLLGGGFGRRLIPDFAAQAALIAMEVAPTAVQLTWTREEDVTHDHYRRATLTRFRAGLRADGLIDGYEAISAAADQMLNDADPAPYGFSGFAATQSRIVTGVPQGPWRSVDPGLSAFGRESFIDECAHAAGVDPLEYRRRLIGDDQRVRRLIDAAAEAIGWGKPKARGVGRGLALVRAFESLVATGVEAQVEGDALKVARIAVAADVGTAVNPQQVKAQFEGGATMGLSAALGEVMTFAGGRANQANFNAYHVIRMRQAPPVEVILFDTPGVNPGGAGEPGVPGVAPALANAVFDATGRRVRSLPFVAQGFTV